MPLEVDLKDLFLGKVIEVEVDKQVLCHKCHGLGAKSEADVVKCNACGGQGARIVRQMFAPGMFQQMQVP